ncbi:MAG: N-6 DNA methylase [Bacteroidia bacterium]|nr:N-6 DNA methylase [Bacteroidia bacterium]
MREVNYHNPKDVLEFKVLGILDVIRNSQVVNSNDELLSIGFLFLSLYKDGLLEPEHLRDKGTFEQYCQDFNNRMDESNSQKNYLLILNGLMGTLSRLSNSVIQLLSYKLVDFNGFDKIALRDNFSEIFDKILYKYAKADGRFTGEFIQPEELTHFMFNLANLKSNSKVFNPFAGLASFGVLLNEGSEYFGQELNEKTWQLGALRLMAHNKFNGQNYVCQDSVHCWPDSSQHFDLIISSPPFGVRLNNFAENESKYALSIETFLVSNGIKSLKHNGKLISLLPHGFLFKGMQENGLAEHLVEQDLIDAIISLPAGLLSNTGIPLIILFINKNKKYPGKVRFIDAKGLTEFKDNKKKTLNYQELLKILGDSEDTFEGSIVSEPALNYPYSEDLKKEKEDSIQRIVDNGQIRELGYNLNIPRYFQETYEGIPLSELGTVVKGNKYGENQMGKQVRVSDLNEDSIEFVLDLNKLTDTSIPKNYTCISESCLLLAIKGKTLRPTYFNYFETPIFISNDIVAFKIDESKAFPQFLINELSSAYVNDQLNSFRVGSVIPAIKKNDLLSVKISLPGVDEDGINKQQFLAKQKLMQLAEEKKKELILFNKIHGLENEIYEQNTYLRHTLAGPSSNLKDSIGNIKSILLEKVVPLHPQILNLKLSERHQITLGEYLDFIERDADKIVSAVSNQLKVEIEMDKKKLEPVGIIQFLESFTSKHSEREGLNYTMEFSLDEEAFKNDEGNFIETYILANIELLDDLFNNLIDNAVKHAFSPEKSNRFEIFLMKLSGFGEIDSITILFSNTGTPFPKDFTFNDFIRKGSRVGSNAGDGFGGWYINEIIKKFNGYFDIINEQESDGLPGTDLATSFEISFPIFDFE